MKITGAKQKIPLNYERDFGLFFLFEVLTFKKRAEVLTTIKRARLWGPF